MANDVILPETTVTASAATDDRQWNRKVSLIVGDSDEALDLSNLRFTFHVRRGDLQTPNSARIRIYNLGDYTAYKIEREFTRVVLQAGYPDNFGVIFDGTLIQPRRGRESQADTFLDLTCADGDSAYNFATVNTTLAAGSTLKDHVGVCTRAMAQQGVTPGYIADLPSNPLPRGKVFYGPARDFMSGVDRTAQTVWSIQDGKLQVVPETSYVPGEVLVVNSKTGMVGMPQQTRNGITIKMLLNPLVKIGGRIQLNNASIQQFENPITLAQQAENGKIGLQNKINGNPRGDGHYYTMIAEHWGDTRGNDWYTEAVCLAIDATATDIGLANKATPGAIAPPLNAIRKDL